MRHRLVALVVVVLGGAACAGSSSVDPSEEVGTSTSALASVTLASGAWQPLRLTIDASNVYWTTGGAGGAVMSAPLGTGGATTLTTAPVGFTLLGIAVNGTALFYTYGDSSATERIATVSTSGGFSLTLEMLEDEGPDRGFVAADASYVYFVDDSGIGRCSHSGGAVTYLNAEADETTTLALNATDSRLFFGSATSGVPPKGVVKSVSAAAVGPAKTLVTEGVTIDGLAVLGTTAYWINAGSGTVESCATTGCSGIPNKLVKVTSPVAIAAHSGKLVVGTSSSGDAGAGGNVVEINASTGVVRVLARDQPGVTSVAADAKNVYWDTWDGATGTIKQQAW